MSADHLEELVEKLRRKSGVATLPEDCFAMIRLPVSLTALAGFVKVASKLSKDCVMRQEGVLHAPKKEVKS